MAIAIDEIQTEVQMEAPATEATRQTPSQWQELDRMRQLQAQLWADAERTRAAGNDD